MRCTRGRVFDVVVDLRPASPTHRSWLGIELDAASASAVYVPEGCAHGFQTLLPDSELLYSMSHRYVPEASSGVRWDDPAFAIEWPEAGVRTISERDRSWPGYQPEPEPTP